MKPYPKRIKRQLNELVGLAYENELARELGKLAQHFDEWRDLYTHSITVGHLNQ